MWGGPGPRLVPLRTLDNTDQSVGFGCSASSGPGRPEDAHPLQTRSEDKRQRIRRAAAELFATRPYHEVLLSDVAAAAGVGKGTIYVYFENKDSLYLSVYLEEFVALVDALDASADAAPDAPEALRQVVQQLVAHIFGSPHVSELLRNVGAPGALTPFREQHGRLTALIAKVIRRGVEAGRFQDPRPDLTAVYLPGIVRSALLYGPQGLTAVEVSEHLVGLLLSALAAR